MELSSIIRNVSCLIENEENHNSLLEEMNYVKRDNIFGAAPAYDKCLAIEIKNARLQIIAAQHCRNEFNLSSDEFESLANKCNAFDNRSCECNENPRRSVHPKYRPIDGRGINSEHPDWGASSTTFLRFGSNNYEDGIYSIKKSVTGSDLPSARLIVQEVLSKTVRSAPPPYMYNVFASLGILFISHDVHYQIPMQPQNVDDEIQCCSRNRQEILPPCLSHSSCLPIEVSTQDSFYKHEKIGCLNMVRSQIGKSTDKFGPGIINHATSYLDLSLIYGNHEQELKPIRSFNKGTFRLGNGNILAVDSKGNYLPSMKRFSNTPITSIWPTLFFRNHNYLATELAKQNFHWNDETIFQEARRINIANFQYNLVTSKMLEVALNNTPIHETYSPDKNAGTFLEFAIVYRAMHYYLHSEMLFLTANNTATRYLQSDLIGKTGILEERFDHALRGATSQIVNTGGYSDEVIK